MRGIVIAGGLGTRLRPLTLNRPKPLMPLVNAPLLEYQLHYLKAAGIQEICFATNYMSEVVADYFGDGSGFGLKLVYAVESEPLDTAGAIRNAYDAFPGDSCVVFNGDTIHGFDISQIIETHRNRKAEVTLTLKSVERPHPYGVVSLDEEQRVLGFAEPSEEAKRQLNNQEPGFDAINAGLYVMSKEAIETIPQRRCNIEREVFPKLIADGWTVFGHVQDKFWIDIGRPSQYLEATRAVVDGVVATPEPLNLINGGHVCPTAMVQDIEILEGSAVFEEAKIGKGTRLINSVVMKNAEIGENCYLEQSIIGEGCKIGSNSRIIQSVLADESELLPYSMMGTIS